MSITFRNAIKKRSDIRLAVASLLALILFALVTSQYAKAVVVARLKATHQLPAVVGSWHSLTPYRLPGASQRIVKVLLPKEVGLLLKAVARAAQLSGTVAALYIVLSSVKKWKSDKWRSASGAFRGATIFGAASAAPEIIRGLASVSLGFVPF